MIVLLAVGAAKVVVAVTVMALERYCPDLEPTDIAVALKNECPADLLPFFPGPPSSSFTESFCVVTQP